MGTEKASLLSLSFFPTVPLGPLEILAAARVVCSGTGPRAGSSNREKNRGEIADRIVARIEGCKTVRLVFSL